MTYSPRDILIAEIKTLIHNLSKNNQGLLMTKSFTLPDYVTLMGCYFADNKYYIISTNKPNIPMTIRNKNLSISIKLADFIVYYDNEELTLIRDYLKQQYSFTKSKALTPIDYQNKIQDIKEQLLNNIKNVISQLTLDTYQPGNNNYIFQTTLQLLPSFKYYSYLVGCSYYINHLEEEPTPIGEISFCLLTKHIDKNDEIHILDTYKLNDESIEQLLEIYEHLNKELTLNILSKLNT